MQAEPASSGLGQLGSTYPPLATAAAQTSAWPDIVCWPFD